MYYLLCFNRPTSVFNLQPWIPVHDCDETNEIAKDGCGNSNNINEYKKHTIECSLNINAWLLIFCLPKIDPIKMPKTPKYQN